MEEDRVPMLISQATSGCHYCAVGIHVSVASILQKKKKKRMSLLWHQGGTRATSVDVQKNEQMDVQKKYDSLIGCTRW